MASATVGSPRPSCQSAIGSWLVTMVERDPGPVLDHFEQVGGLRHRSSGCRREVVEDEDVDFGPRRREALGSRPSSRAVASSVSARGVRR